MLQEIWIVSGTKFISHDKPVKMVHNEYTDRVRAQQAYDHLILLGYRVRCDKDLREVTAESRARAKQILGLC